MIQMEHSLMQNTSVGVHWPQVYPLKGFELRLIPSDVTHI